ncbi:hypothetical protein NC652_019397 [Populus alba x Populus x berolinensis]|uniref:Uncharacterized protein n=1 Tax=Populus tomentosa TaxID=118781 RepID=A0A8X8CW38_POPTO|nr:hypothetical protein POTOM_027374 [Populus tomentosa]KAJ6916982.1 hypothetical protein NC652_019397 [Populus alba x Populus x berolinensis]
MPSIEALAMAGVDCVECGISFEERERRDVEKTPQYLLADQGEEGDLRSHEKDKLMGEQRQVKTKMESAFTKIVSTVHGQDKKL